MRGLVVDLFAGGGGASVGIERALGRSVDVAINHDATALAVHKANHPGTLRLEADIWEVRPEEVVRGRPVDLLWASPDCTHFSVAKGDVPRSAGIRSLAWAVVRWAKAVRPRVILLENVREFQGWGPLGRDRKPNKARAGSTFRAWVGRLRGLGYQVEWRVLDASTYGAPTRRRRLFVCARADGLPIVWPEPTHGPGRLPFRTAAECIDWSIPCPSIFERKRPLADKTLWRIAEGIRRYVLESPRPYLVEMTHANRPRGVDEPLGVVTTQGNRFNVVTPVIVGCGGRAGETLPTGGAEPLGVITAKNDRCVLAPTLMKFRHDSAGARADAPMPTITAGGKVRPERPATGNPLGLLGATLINTRNGEREGQTPRALDLEAPAPTVTAQGSQGALVAAFLAKHFGGVVGHAMDERVATVTARDHHSLAAASLVKLRGQCSGADPREPAPTLTAGGQHVGEVRAFLTAYYREGTPGQSLFDPLRTVTTKHRLGLVTIDQVEYQIVDIGMRMLEPHELLRAQFGDFAENYDLGAARTKSAKVRLIGNSVAPNVAEALVRANVLELAVQEAG